MTLGFWFWLIYVLCLFYGGWFVWWPQGRIYFANSILFWLLIGILGWHAFGNPLVVLVR